LQSCIERHLDKHVSYVLRRL